jgi:hypothetical protein
MPDRPGGEVMPRAKSNRQDLFGRDVGEDDTIVDEVVGRDNEFSPVWVPRRLMNALEPISSRLGCRLHELFVILIAFGVAHEEELVEFIERMKRKHGQTK